MKEQVSQALMLKPVLLLTTLLFLLVAPTPDSQDIAEMSANFLILNHQPGLLASETTEQTVQKEILN